MLVKKFDHLKELRRRIVALQRAKLKVGYWEEQGIHYSYEGGEGISYPYLAYIHNEGLGVPARPFFAIGMMEKPIKSNPVVKANLKRYFSNIKGRPSLTATQVLENVAGDYVQTFQGIIGSLKLQRLTYRTISIKKDKGAKKPEAPLFHSGKLQENLTYKVSKLS